MENDPQNIARDLHKAIRRPGANRKSLRIFLEKKSLPRTDAADLAEEIIRKLTIERLPPISEIELMLTRQCDHRCDYCFVEGKEAGEEMSEETGRAAVNFLFNHCRAAETLEIFFFGGEPLLEFGLIETITTYAETRAAEAGKKITFSMTTNGTLCDEKKVSFLSAHRIRFLLSLDGDQKTHDRHRKLRDGSSAYQAVTANLAAMKKQQPWLGARMTVHPDSVENIVHNVIHLAGLGINQFLIGPTTGLEWSNDKLNIYRDRMIEVARWLKEQLDRGKNFRFSTLEENGEMLGGKRNLWGCRAGRRRVAVNGRGEIYPCSKMKGVDGSRGIYRLGNLAEGLSEIYNRLVLCDLIPAERSICETCQDAGSCMGGCYADNYRETGSIFRHDPFTCRLKRRTDQIIAAAEKILGTDYYRSFSRLYD